MSIFVRTKGQGVVTQERLVMLNRIRDKAQAFFDNRLEVQYNDTGSPLEPDFWHSIVEVATERWLIFPYKKRKTLFAIKIGFIGAAHGKKEIYATVFDQSILEIIQIELRDYAKRFEVTSVNLVESFA